MVRSGQKLVRSGPKPRYWTRVSDGSTNLGDARALFESVVDAGDRVVRHREQKARRELRLGGAGVKEGRARMYEPRVPKFQYPSDSV